MGCTGSVKGIRTLSEISSANGVHPNAIGKWKRQLVAGAPLIFSQGADGNGMSEDEITAPLYEEIGRLKVENNWLKKNSKDSFGGQTAMDRGERFGWFGNVFWPDWLGRVITTLWRGKARRIWS